MPVTLTINERTVSAEPGTTVLEAALANGIYIPTLCYAPKLKPFGGCRLCVVEIEKMGGMPTACTTPVAQGMVVRTETPAVQQQRRETLSLLLSDHPYTCLTCGSNKSCVEFQGTIRKAAVTTGCNYCPKNGQCEIQTVLDHIGLCEVPYPITYRGLPVEHDDPFFDRDMNLCIVCNRCVRACNDVRHAGVLGLVQRGHHTVVATASGKSLLEAGCQFCGACVDACPTGAFFDKKSKWEGVPDTITPSVCAYCSVGCAVNMQTRGGKLLRAVGNDDGPVNGGEICVRGRFAMVDVVHNGARIKSPWAKRGLKLAQVTWDAALDSAAQGLSQYQGDQFAAIGSATASNEDLYALQKFTRTVMRSNNVAIATGFPDAAAVRPALMAGSASIRSLRDAATIVVIGANPCRSHPIVGLEIRHALSKGARLIVIDPRRSDLASMTSQWLAVRAGADHVLLGGLLKGLAAIGKAAADLAPRLSLRTAAQASGVSARAITAAAQALAARAPVTIVYGSGVTHQPQAANTMAAIDRLAAALHASVIMLPGAGNTLGAYDMGMHPGWQPGYRPLRRAGRDYQGIVDGIRSGAIKALYLAGDVPPLPELSKVPFLIVQGIMHSDGAKSAQVVLPTTTFAEAEGTLTNLEGRVQRLRKVVEPVGQARPGWMIVRDLARRLGRPWKVESAADVTAEIARAVPGYGALGAEPGLDGVLRRYDAGTAKLRRFSVAPAAAVASADYPITLIDERNQLAYGGANLSKEVKGMAEFRPENALLVSAADATRLGISDGQPIKIVSAHGSVYWPAHVDVALAAGYAWASVNPLVGAAIYPNMTPQRKLLAVRLEVSD